MSLVREPVLHFVLAGAVLFAVFAVIANEPPPVVTVDDGIRTRLQAEFASKTGREPTVEEEDSLTEAWIDDEVLYREALARGLDRDDPVIRRRLVAKMRVLLANTDDVDPTDAQLQAFLDAHADRYRILPQVSFRHIYIGRQNPDAIALSVALQKRIEEGADWTQLGDPFAGGRTFRGAAEPVVAASFGDAFARTVMTLPPGRWSQTLSSDHGHHLVHVDGVQPAKVPPLDDVRERVTADWKRARAAEVDPDVLSELRARHGAP